METIAVHSHDNTIIVLPVWLIMILITVLSYGGYRDNGAAYHTLGNVFKKLYIILP